LFLDVFVPEDILHSAKEGEGAPVLVWIYGGGYINGNKYENPAGLLAASGNVSNGNIIYVALNYRLGAFGFSSGPSFNAEGGISNAALYDQRFALEWVQKYIHLFGGDPNRVTIFGESAGGGSVMHQITAYGGKNGPVPFQQAVPQSPGWIPVASNRQQEDTFWRLLNLTNTTSLEELRALPEEDLIRANYLQVLEAPYSTYAYGPVVDGDFVPLEPAQLLAQGKFDKNISIMVGHNQNEGTYFTPSWIQTEDGVDEQLRTAYPYIPQGAIDHITDNLYPPVFDGSLGYTSQFTRASLMVAESIFTCNTFYLDKAYGNRTYSYLFAVPPAFHGLDVPYTYFTGGAPSTSPIGVTNLTIAMALQEFITSFAIEGKPAAEGIRQFNMYGPDANVLELNATGITEVTDSNANERCNWWQKVLYM
jgi:carboxylesterase type B